MNTTGKIARLPRDIRIKLNRRLDNGISSHEILEWLNRDKTVRKILSEQFDSSPVSKQNLSAWRTGGYQEWTTHRDALELIKDISGEADDVFSVSGGEDGGPAFSEKMALWYAARYLILAKKVMVNAEKGDLDKQEAAMHRIGRELANLRRADHSAARIRLERERFEFQSILAYEAQEKASSESNPKAKPAKPRGHPGLSTRDKIEKVRYMLFGDKIVAPSSKSVYREERIRKETEEKRQAAASPVKPAQSNSDAPKVQNSSSVTYSNEQAIRETNFNIPPGIEFPPESRTWLETHEKFYLWTPLHEAVEIGRKDIVEALIASDANINAKDLFSRTPLHIAAIEVQKEIAEVLITAGAELSIPALDGWTPLDHAQEAGQPELVELLIRHGATQNTKNSIPVKP
ncbi:MAG: ankyrin repeat domain-containing protein [Chthoniobacteraceae bacterium]